MADYHLDQHSSTSQHYFQEPKEDRRTRELKFDFSEDEEVLIARMFSLVGDRWSLIAGRIPGRTAEEIQMYWNSRYSSSR